ncbi:MAG TPA: alpha/beta fold hydrolase [Dictyobacter sp.]|nr:alpha/beta fold hydrolase [Dictyobacter sp.]
MIVRNPWIVRTNARTQPDMRLFCFPYAGGGASIYRQWANKLPATIEVCAIQLPGREHRLKETAYTSLPPLIEALLPELEQLLDQPFAVFGHSMGALLAFETVRALRRRQQPLPTHLFISADRAPQPPRKTANLYLLDDEPFIAELQKLGGMPDAILQYPELLDLVIPTLRADMTLYDTYEYQPDAPLNIPFSLFGGETDGSVTSDNLLSWREQTAADYHFKLFPGGHFYLQSNLDLLLTEIRQDLHLSF